VSYHDVGRDSVEFSTFGTIIYSLPVSFVRASNRFLSEFPRAFEPGIFFDAVVKNAVVSLNTFSKNWYSFKLGDPYRAPEV